MNDRNDLRTRQYPPERVTAAARATYAAFIGAGFVFASWASRIPQVRDRLQLSPADLGLALLAIAGGSLVALPLAKTIVHRLNSRRTVAGMFEYATATFYVSRSACVGGIGYDTL